MVQARNITKSFQTQVVLRGVDLSVEKGDVVAILGPSGSGKTTLLRCLNFLETADGGTLEFDGETFRMGHVSRRDIARLRKKTAFVFQSYNLFSNRTALGNVTEGLITGRGMDKEKAMEIGRRALDKVGLSDRYDYYPHQLSGGQLQRISIIRSMFLQPKFIIADEPVSMLDVSVRAEIIRILQDMSRKQNAAVAFISHDIALTRYISDRIAVMYLGRIVEYGDADDVIGQPMHPYTRALLSNCASIDPDEKTEPIEIQGEPPTPVNPGPGCYFAPRCHMACPACFEAYPQLSHFANGHYAACQRTAE